MDYERFNYWSIMLWHVGGAITVFVLLTLFAVFVTTEKVPHEYYLSSPNGDMRICQNVDWTIDPCTAVGGLSLEQVVEQLAKLNRAE